MYNLNGLSTLLVPIHLQFYGVVYVIVINITIAYKHHGNFDLEGVVEKYLR